MALTAAPLSTPRPKKVNPAVRQADISTMSALYLKQNKEIPKGIAMLGPAGTGKTWSVLSLINYLIDVERLAPEQIHIELIDLDIGFGELLDDTDFPDPYLACVQYTACASFHDVVAATQQAYERLKDHKSKHGLPGTWICVDNMAKAWDWAQDDVCRILYGMSLADKMKQVRRSQIEAKASQGTKKGETKFNQQLDYGGVINPWHNEWAESFKHSGSNFLWLSPWSIGEEKDVNDKVISTYIKFGQKSNEQRVSYIMMRKAEFINNKLVRTVDVHKARGLKTPPQNIRDVSIKGIFASLEQMAHIEQKERDAIIKTRDIPIYTQEDPLPSPPSATSPSPSPITTQEDDNW